MVWLPGVDEIPMSLSMINHLGLSRITVGKIGEATKAVHEMKRGDLLGLRGPFGNWFIPYQGHVMVVGGGTGIAPLLPLTRDLVGLETDVTFVLGAKTQNELLFLNELQTSLSNNGSQIIVTTEDGSRGFKGVVCDVLEDLFKEKKFDMVYTCGSELMMRKVFDISEKYMTPIQTCMERIIRCSIGLCGSCLIGKYRICRDGPVLTSTQLREVLDEFGKFKRDFDGKRISF
jgi:dihydroorotate dehydrogenase electron transfer subunit